MPYEGKLMKQKSKHINITNIFPTNMSAQKRGEKNFDSINKSVIILNDTQRDVCVPAFRTEVYLFPRNENLPAKENKWKWKYPQTMYERTRSCGRKNYNFTTNVVYAICGFKSKWGDGMNVTFEVYITIGNARATHKQEFISQHNEQLTHVRFSKLSFVSS